MRVLVVGFALLTCLLVSLVMESVLKWLFASDEGFGLVVVLCLLFSLVFQEG